MQGRACKAEHARQSMPGRACKGEHARQSMQGGACKAEHARQSMPGRACKADQLQAANTVQYVERGLKLFHCVVVFFRGAEQKSSPRVSGYSCN